MTGRLRRNTHFTRVSRLMGFDGPGEYLTDRFVVQAWRVADIAQEADVSENTVRRFLKEYGFTTGSPRQKRVGQRRGVNIICTRCSKAKYYSPSVYKKLKPATYKCAGCKKLEYDEL